MEQLYMLIGQLYSELYISRQTTKQIQETALKTQEGLMTKIQGLESQLAVFEQIRNKSVTGIQQE